MGSGDWLKAIISGKSMKADRSKMSKVAQIAVRASLQSSGQNCAGAKRYYVHHDIYNTFVAQVVKIVKSVTAGPPLAGKYGMGAICMQEHAEKLRVLYPIFDCTDVVTCITQFWLVNSIV